MLSSLEILLNVGAFPFLWRRATRPLSNGLERVGRPGSKNMCKRGLGFPRNLGDPDVSTQSTAGRGYRLTNPRPAVGTR